MIVVAITTDRSREVPPTTQAYHEVQLAFEFFNRELFDGTPLDVPELTHAQLMTATRLAKRGLTNVKVACGDAKLFLRDQDTLYCYDVAPKES